MKRWVRRCVGLLLIGDSMLTLIWGRAFLRWQRRHVPALYKPVLDALLRWPYGLLLTGATLELMLGCWLLWRELRNGNGRRLVEVAK